MARSDELAGIGQKRRVGGGNRLGRFRQARLSGNGSRDRVAIVADVDGAPVEVPVAGTQREHEHKAHQGKVACHFHGRILLSRFPIDFCRSLGLGWIQQALDKKSHFTTACHDYVVLQLPSTCWIRKSFTNNSVCLFKELFYFSNYYMLIRSIGS